MSLTVIYFKLKSKYYRSKNSDLGYKLIMKK